MNFNAFISHFKTTETYKHLVENCLGPEEDENSIFELDGNGKFKFGNDGFGVVQIACEAWKASKDYELQKSLNQQSTYFSHDFNGDGFKYHSTLDEAKQEAVDNLDWYRDRVADGHHVESDGEFNELCYGVVIASASYEVDEVVNATHHENDEYTNYEIGTEILSLSLDDCDSNNEEKSIVVTKAITDILDERERQKSQEGYKNEHDDLYEQNELSRAAGSYANYAANCSSLHESHPSLYQRQVAPDNWPFDKVYWKPKSPRQDLVRAAALLIAEIERIDRKFINGGNQNGL